MRFYFFSFNFFNFFIVLKFSYYFGSLKEDDAYLSLYYVDGVNAPCLKGSVSCVIGDIEFMIDVDFLFKRCREEIPGRLLFVDSRDKFLKYFGFKSLRALFFYLFGFSVSFPNEEMCFRFFLVLFSSRCKYLGQL